MFEVTTAVAAAAAAAADEFIIAHIACRSLWEANESEILLFNSFHIHYKKLMNWLRDFLLFKSHKHTRSRHGDRQTPNGGHSHLNSGRAGGFCPNSVVVVAIKRAIVNAGFSF